MELMLFLGISFLATLLVGVLLEKIRVPWIFGALLVGTLYSCLGIQMDSFSLLAQIGMLFLLFIIGFEMDLREIKKQSRFIFKLTFLIIPFEAIFGALVLHFFFGVDWILAAVVALSFATVGEAMLVPILDEFGILRKRFGQIVIGIGTLDDAIEVFTIILISMILGVATYSGLLQTGIALLLLAVSFIAAILLTKVKNRVKLLQVPMLGATFLFILFMLFVFAGIGAYAGAEALGAILAGIAAKNFIPKKRIEAIDHQIKATAYGLFAPLFFLWVGMNVDLSLVLEHLPLVALVAGVALLAKIIASVLLARQKLGLKKSILLGIALSVRFSTSLVIINLLYTMGVITQLLFSILIASTVLFQLLIPSLLSYLIVEWGVKG